jgi:hypothetical protein
MLARYDQAEEVIEEGLSWLRAAGAPVSSSVPLRQTAIECRMRRGGLPRKPPVRQPPG